MASTYSDLKIELIGTGEQAGTWGTTTNTNLGTALEEAITGSATVTFSSADETLTLTNTNASQTARHFRIVCSGTSGGARQLILDAGCQIDKFYLIQNDLADDLTVINGDGAGGTSGTGAVVLAGTKGFVYNDGTNVIEAITISGGINYEVKTANYTAKDKEGILADTSGGAFTVTLPASPSAGDQVFIADPTGDWGTNNLTLGRNSSTISGAAEDLVCDISGASVQVVYDGTTWAVYAQVGGNGGAVVTETGAQTISEKNLKDYSIEGSIVGNTDSTETIDMEDANFFAMTANTDCTFTFSNPPASGDFGTFVLELTNGGAHTLTWPASVDWVGGTAPTLTSAGVDQLVFTTRDGGTTYFGFVAGLDIKSP